MDKTRVDGMLIEMITPKVKEIEEKFGQGQGLTQDDINTLLLKSQYNHINHLDDKLNEVAASVTELEDKFIGLENKFGGLENKFVGLEGKFIGLEGKFAGLESKFVGLENKFDALEARLDLKFDLLNEKIEATIQKALNKNMIMLMGMMGFFLTLSKALDIFIK